MPNSIYDSARYKLLTATLNWLTTDLILVAWGGEPDFVKTDTTIADIIARNPAAELGYSGLLLSKSVSVEGAAQTGVAVIPGITVGAEITWFTLCANKPVHTASEPILFLDEGSFLPFLSNGLDIIVQPDWVQNRGWFFP